MWLVCCFWQTNFLNIRLIWSSHSLNFFLWICLKNAFDVFPHLHKIPSNNISLFSVISVKSSHCAMYSSNLAVSSCSWIAGNPPFNSAKSSGSVATLAQNWDSTTRIIGFSVVGSFGMEKTADLSELEIKLRNLFFKARTSSIILSRGSRFCARPKAAGRRDFFFRCKFVPHCQTLVKTLGWNSVGKKTHRRNIRHQYGGQNQRQKRIVEISRLRFRGTTFWTK